MNCANLAEHDTTIAAKDDEALFSNNSAGVGVCRTPPQAVQEGTQNLGQAQVLTSPLDPQLAATSVVATGYQDWRMLDMTDKKVVNQSRRDRSKPHQLIHLHERTWRCALKTGSLL